MHKERIENGMVYMRNGDEYSTAQGEANSTRERTKHTGQAAKRKNPKKKRRARGWASEQ
jgi:hypothetical protein